MEARYIDIQVKEWNDKVNGNTYFAGLITVNATSQDEALFLLPSQYGYGDQYLHQAGRILTEFNKISMEHGQSLSRYCRANNIVLTHSKQGECLKRELKEVSATYDARTLYNKQLNDYINQTIKTNRKDDKSKQF